MMILPIKRIIMRISPIVMTRKMRVVQKKARSVTRLLKTRFSIAIPLKIIKQNSKKSLLNWLIP